MPTKSLPTITVIGSLNMDLVVRTPRFPDAGETIGGHDFYTIPGGKGANQAVAIARQGVHVHMVGHVGQDQFGEQIFAALQKEQIDTVHLRVVSDAATGVAIIAVDEQGENRIILAPGANHRLTPHDIDLAAGTIAASNAVVMQMEIPLAVVAYAARVAKHNGVPVILNAAPAPTQPLPEELIDAVDYLIVNEMEAALLAGTRSTDLNKAANRLLSSGFGNVIVTLGEDGSLFAVEQHGQRQVEPVPSFLVQAVDTTAAGDAFVGAFASALTRGKEVREAVRWGNAAGALAATVLGAQPSLPSYAAIQEFLAQQTGSLETSEGGGPLHL